MKKTEALMVLLLLVNAANGGMSAVYLVHGAISEPTEPSAVLSKLTRLDRVITYTILFLHDVVNK